MNQDPQAIRRDIEDTQIRMGETVEALAYKADVPSRTRDAVNDRVETIKGKVADAIGSATGVVRGAANAMPSRNALSIAIGAAAVGFLVGLLLPGITGSSERYS